MLGQSILVEILLHRHIVADVHLSRVRHQRNAKVLGVAIMIILNPNRKMGFGDVKLMAAIGAFIWWKGVLLTFLYFAILYGAVSIWKMTTSLPWKHIWQAMMLSGGNADLAMEQVKPHLEDFKKAMKSRMALGPVMFLGLALAIFLEGPTLEFMGFK